LNSSLNGMRRTVIGAVGAADTPTGAVPTLVPRCGWG
jgi:hypothetical protein